MKVFKNKILGIIAAVAIFAAVFYSVLGIIGATSVLHNTLGVVATPFRWCFQAMGNALSGFGDYVTEFRELRDQNKELAARIEELERENAHVQVLEGENAWLRGLLGVKNTLTLCETVDARVIGREANSYKTLYTLNKGSLHGIDEGMAVVTDAGVVGRVESVGLNWCRVSAIVEDGVSAGAICARSGARGIVDGSLGLRGKGQCSMNYISEFADVEIGDAIISAGGSVYPYGFPIGTVVDKTFDAASRTVSAIIEPSVNFDTLSWVLVVVDMRVEEMQDLADAADVARQESETERE